MFDTHSKNQFIEQMPVSLQKLITAIEKREPWVVKNSEKVESMIDDIGLSLRSHRNIEQLENLSTSELSTLFFGLTLTRYLAALNRLSEYPKYMDNIVQRLHNDIHPEDLDTSNQQRILLARLRTLVQFEVIHRTFSKERRDRVASLLDRG